MTTMYDTIMDLPLFKGISADQVSEFLEKTHVDFYHYHKGDVVFAEDSSCRDIRYILKGKIRVTHLLFQHQCSLRETLQPATVIGADRLFGLHPIFRSTGIADEDVSVMWISKEQYMNLVRSDEIFLMNYLNYLSLRAQRPIEILQRIYAGSLLTFLANCVEFTTERNSSNIEVTISMETLGRLTNMSQRELTSQISALRRLGVAIYSGPKKIFRIPSREQLVEMSKQEFEGINKAEGDFLI